MGMRVDIKSNSCFLGVRMSGDFFFDESVDIITRIYQALSQHSQQKVLVDFRHVKGEPEMFERFLIAVFLASEMDRFSGVGVSRSTLFAFLGTEPMIDKGRLGETVAINQGINVKVTESIEVALRWLEIDPLAYRNKNKPRFALPIPARHGMRRHSKKMMPTPYPDRDI
jgi:hypothetical protein